MGFCLTTLAAMAASLPVPLLGALDPDLLGDQLIGALLAAAGIGLVIFVHELGHFAVAKMCGVKCEKFMIGFDLGGLKLSKRWGETEYGIGILPLGGYVKMLGQDDNPANVAEQLKESMASGAVEGKEVWGPDGKKYWIDKRSYMAKSVPQRMAIISAGVVMNIIFAFIFAAIAYKLGVPYQPSVISQTAPGSPAWQADIRPGDEVVEIAGVKNPSFEELQGNVMLGDVKNGIAFVIQRGDERIAKTLRPDQASGRPRVGVTSPMSLRLSEKMPVLEHTAAAQAEPQLAGKDEIVAVDGQPVANFGQLSTYLTTHADSPITLRVRRGAKKKAQELDVRIAPQPQQSLGLTMQIGRVAAVQEGSPAAQAGIKPGDFLDRITPADASSAAEQTLGGDPLELTRDLQKLAADGRSVTITLRSAAPDERGRQTPKEVRVALRPFDRSEPPIAPLDPVAVPALGVAYQVLNVVASVAPDSPAAQAGLASGDVVVQANVEFPANLKPERKSKPIHFSDGDEADRAAWPWFAEYLQTFPPGTKVQLSYKRGEETREAALVIADDPHKFANQRGFLFEGVERTRRADNWGEAVRLGYREAKSALGLVYRFLGKLGSQVKPTELGGPLTIATAAWSFAFQGPGKLLTFLTMLSANLAVINFLPIPILDGGHMAFLAWEGIRGKPAGEKFALTLQTAGLLFIVTLMLFVFSLDIRRLFFA